MSQERNRGSEFFSAAPSTQLSLFDLVFNKERFPLPPTNLSEQKIQKQNELQIKTNRFYRCQME